jgi:hypothetical protein
MGQSALLFLFVTRANIHPDTHRDGVQMGDLLGDHPDAVVQDRLLVQALSLVVFGFVFASADFVSPAV